MIIRTLTVLKTRFYFLIISKCVHTCILKTLISFKFLHKKTLLMQFARSRNQKGFFWFSLGFINLNKQTPDIEQKKQSNMVAPTNQKRVSIYFLTIAKNHTRASETKLLIRLHGSHAMLMGRWGFFPQIRISFLKYTGNKMIENLTHRKKNWIRKFPENCKYFWSDFEYGHWTA